MIVCHLYTLPIKKYKNFLKKNLTFALVVTILNTPPQMAGSQIFDILREGIK